MRNTTILTFIINVMIWVPLFGQTTILIPNDYPSIQEGIDEASNGDTVLVAYGTYFENLNFNGKDIVLASYYLRDKDTTHITNTIIDGNSMGPVIVFENEETSGAALMGFTIRGGASDSSYTYGGGVICVNASPQISNNFFTGNFAVSGEFGGAIVCINSGSAIAHNVIDSNGMYFYDYSGAIVSYNSMQQISHNRIRQSFGGYVFKAGGGIIGVDSELDIHHNQITEMHNFDNISGGILLENTTANIHHNSLYLNLQGISLLDTNDVQMENNIVYGQSPFGQGSIYERDSNSTIHAYYNNIEGGWPGTGNIDQNPEFRNVSVLDLRLTENSPCVDAGNPWHLKDPDGTITDMGAYYFHQENTGIFNSYDQKHLNVHPNPGIERVFVELPDYGDSEPTLLIYDVKGQLVRNISSIEENQLYINRNGLPGGMYFLVLQARGQIIGNGRMIFE